MRRFETADSRRMESREMQEFGKLVQKRANAWRKANPGKMEATKEQRNKLIKKINSVLKKAN
ncbi:hypothetical protein [Paraliobacillus sediminis]|uniref:hypothetical protein n=1 Tax=Paraliobacillus sediminis TaxID=1885916 RepID=UPI000E3B7A6D|nr:hypothetical protein [Paraliobacillus sediminis]